MQIIRYLISSFFQNFVFNTMLTSQYIFFNYWIAKQQATLTEISTVASVNLGIQFVLSIWFSVLITKLGYS